MKTGHEKSPDRLTIEAHIAQATPYNPVSAQQLADRTELSVKRVRQILTTLVFEQMTYSCERTGIESWYAAGMRPQPQKPDNMPAPRTAPPSGKYEPAPWTPPRSESMHAFTLPSLHCGQQIERKRPAIIACRAMV